MATLKTLLESLTSTGISGAIPKEIRATLFEQNRVNNPLLALLPRHSTETNKWYWVKRTQLPAGGASLEAPPLTGVGSVSAAASTYANNNSVNIRSLTFKGDVSKIAEQVATRVGSVIGNEIKGQVENEGRVETVQNLYGSENATALTNKIQWSGFDQQIVSTSKTKWNANVTTKLLDGLYDTVRTNAGVPTLGGRWAFIMSPQMETAINALFSNTARTDLPVISAMPNIDADVFGQKNAEFYTQFVRAMAGINVRAYRGCPIIPSSFITPTGQMGTITIGAGGPSGTTFPGAQAYYYQVEAVTQLGKTICSAEVSRTPGAGTSVQLSWSTPNVTDADGNSYPVLHYRIHRAGTTGVAGVSGAETLYAIVAGYDASDNPVTSWTDTNAVNDPLNGGSGTAYVPLNGTPDGVTVPAITATTEDIFLIPIDPDICTMAVLNDTNTFQLAPVLSRSVQFETTADMALALFSGRYAAQATGVTHP